MGVQEKIEDINIDNKEDMQESPLRRSLIIVIGVCMIFLVLSYTIYSNGNDEILLGLIGSVTLESNRINLDNRTIEFEGNSFKTLVEHYVANDGKEIKVCFMGDKEGSRIRLRQVHIPEVYASSYNFVKAEPCPSGTLLSVHSHPNRRCMPSAQDMENYRQLKVSNPSLVVAVICDPGRLYFYD